MGYALFTNFSDKEFIGMWSKRQFKFPPGASKYLPTYLAEHFAKHLTNRELIKEGNEVYTSPKKPLEVPLFMEKFNKACQYQSSDGLDSEIDQLEAEIEAVNKNHAAKVALADVGMAAALENKKPQVVRAADDTDSDDDEFKKEELNTA